MTTVVGIRYKDVLTIGADSLSNNGHVSYIVPDGKVWRAEVKPAPKDGTHESYLPPRPILFGFSGSPRQEEITRYVMGLPYDDTAQPREYIIKRLVPAMIEALSGAGALKKEDEVWDCNSTWLIGYRGQLFRLWGDFQVQEDDVPYAATGSGEPVALGALYTAVFEFRDFVSSGRHILTIALEAATRHNPHTDPPFAFVDDQAEPF